MEPFITMIAIIVVGKLKQKQTNNNNGYNGCNNNGSEIINKYNTQYNIHLFYYYG